MKIEKFMGISYNTTLLGMCDKLKNTNIDFSFFFVFVFGLLISGYVSEAAKLGREDLPTCRSYSLEELKEATNNFDNSTYMGENIYGKVITNIQIQNVLF